MVLPCRCHLCEKYHSRQRAHASPFYSHLSQSSCVKRRLGHSSSATHGLQAFQNYHASNTNPQSVSSYSLRVLKSLHEILRASFSHHWVKRLPKQFTCVAKTLSKSTRVKRVFSKHFPPPKTLSYKSQLSVDCQNRFKRSWDLLQLKKNTLLQASYHSYRFSTTNERFQSYQAQQSFTTVFLLTTKTRAHLKNKRVGKNMHFTTELQGQSKAFYTFRSLRTRRCRRRVKRNLFRLVS